MLDPLDIMTKDIDDLRRLVQDKRQADKPGTGVVAGRIGAVWVYVKVFFCCSCCTYHIGNCDAYSISL